MELMINHASKNFPKVWGSESFQAGEQHPHRKGDMPNSMGTSHPMQLFILLITCVLNQLVSTGKSFPEFREPLWQMN